MQILLYWWSAEMVVSAEMTVAHSNVDRILVSAYKSEIWAVPPARSSVWHVPHVNATLFFRGLYFIIFALQEFQIRVRHSARFVLSDLTHSFTITTFLGMDNLCSKGACCRKK